MLVQFGNNLIQKIPLAAKFWLSLECFSSNYFQIGQHVVLLHILTVIYFKLPITRTFFDFPRRFKLSGVDCR